MNKPTAKPGRPPLPPDVKRRHKNLSLAPADLERLERLRGSMNASRYVGLLLEQADEAYKSS